MFRGARFYFLDGTFFVDIPLLIYLSTSLRSVFSHHAIGAVKEGPLLTLSDTEELP